MNKITYSILQLNFYGEGWEKVRITKPYRGLTLEQAKIKKKTILQEEGSINPIEVYITTV